MLLKNAENSEIIDWIIKYWKELLYLGGYILFGVLGLVFGEFKAKRDNFIVKSAKNLSDVQNDIVIQYKDLIKRQEKEIKGLKEKVQCLEGQVKKLEGKK